MAEYIVKETGYPGTLSQEVVGELIRCKDCRFYTYHDNRAEPLWCCDYWVFEEPIPDGFCNFAERKEGEA